VGNLRVAEVCGHYGQQPGYNKAGVLAQEKIAPE
jgi:hypothetical protein